MTVEKNNEESNYVKKETFYTVVCVAVVVGFFAGVVFSAFKSDSIPSAQKTPSQQTAQQGASQDDATRITALEGQLVQDPKNLQAIVELAHRYFDTGRHEKAITMYTKALELDHSNADIWTDLGVMYRRSKQPELAIEAFNHAMKHNPKHEVSRFNKGVVLLYDLKDKKNAIKAWQELLEINPLAAAPNGLPLTELIKEVEKES